MKMTIDRAGRRETIMIEGANQMDILPGNFRNFRGEKRKAPNGKIVNDEGKRNFNLALNIPAEGLEELRGIGLNVKDKAPRDPEYNDEPLHFVKVNVAFGGKYPPELYLVSGRRMKLLTENELALLDGSRFSNVDLVISTYHNEDSTTLYLQKGYFSIEQDPISAKYADMELGEFADDASEDLPF